MKAKSQIDVPDEMVDEIVEEILSETMSKKSSPKTKVEEDTLLDSNVPELIKLRTRIQNLENRIEKHVHDYKTTAIEVERQIVDKFSEVEQQYEKQLIYLQGQIEVLRNAMIKLSNEFRLFKESISSQK